MCSRIVLTHIDDIRPGDVVEHAGKVVTVCPRDIRRCEGVGTTLFGDSYRLGHLAVRRVVFDSERKRDGL